MLPEYLVIGISIFALLYVLSFAFWKLSKYAYMRRWQPIPSNYERSYRETIWNKVLDIFEIPYRLYLHWTKKCTRTEKIYSELITREQIKIIEIATEWKDGACSPNIPCLEINSVESPKLYRYVMRDTSNVKNLIFLNKEVMYQLCTLHDITIKHGLKVTLHNNRVLSSEKNDEVYGSKITFGNAYIHEVINNFEIAKKVHELHEYIETLRHSDDVLPGGF